LGSGFMGAGIASIAIQHDTVVRLKDTDAAHLGKGLAAIRDVLDERVVRRQITRPQADDLMTLVGPTTDYSGFEATDLVIEAVFEELEAKRAVFAELERVCAAGAILATNTSALSVGAIAAELEHPERVAGMHFFNPAPLMPLVEVVRAERTSDDVIEALVAFAKRLGREPVRCADTPGFVVNRVLIPLLNDCVRVLDETGVSPDDLDKAMTLGAGWPLGPCALLDLVGIDVHVHASETLYAALGEERMAPPGRLLELQRAGKLGRKTGHGFYAYTS
jgi:3-hydroxybutyryl-CoA dehydrogenase